MNPSKVRMETTQKITMMMATQIATKKKRTMVMMKRETEITPIEIMTMMTIVTMIMEETKMTKEAMMNKTKMKKS